MTTAPGFAKPFANCVLCAKHQWIHHDKPWNIGIWQVANIGSMVDHVCEMEPYLIISPHFPFFTHQGQSRVLVHTLV